MTERAEICSYKLGDEHQGINVEVDTGVFVPTNTSRLLVSCLRRNLRGRYRTLDLGCGCGYVGLVLAKLGITEGMLFASDVSPEAVANCTRNAGRLGIGCDARVGNLFDCWARERFDLIVDDVSGVAEEVAGGSSWFPEFAPCGAGLDGAALTVQVLECGVDYVTPGGVLVFPVLSLSNECRILAKAEATFHKVKRLGQQFFPVSDELGTRIDTLQKLMSAGHINLRQLRGTWVWWTSVYQASCPR